MMMYIILEKGQVQVKPHIAKIHGKLAQVKRYTRSDSREKTVSGSVEVDTFEKNKKQKSSFEDMEKLNVMIGNEKMTKEKVLAAFAVNVPNTKVEVQLKSRCWDADDFDVAVTYRKGTGNQIGHNHLYVYNEPGIGLVCSFSLMELDPDYQKQGYGYEFYKRLETNLKNWGVKKIRLFADLDVGGYAWARYGLDFADDYTIKTRVKGFIKYLNKYQIQEDANKFKHSWDVATYVGPAGETFGKDYLLESNWLAVKDLDENSLGWKVGQAYAEERKAKVGASPKTK